MQITHILISLMCEIEVGGILPYTNPEVKLTCSALQSKRFFSVSILHQKTIWCGAASHNSTYHLTLSINRDFHTWGVKVVIEVQSIHLEQLMTAFKRYSPPPIPLYFCLYQLQIRIPRICILYIKIFRGIGLEYNRGIIIHDTYRIYTLFFDLRYINKF